MNNLFEIIWHGRGGQGAVTASKIVAEAALSEGKHIQAFPEYGAERSGAPVRSFTRISTNPLHIHSQIKHPNAVVVLDPTLLDAVDVAEGLKDDGALIINTPLSPAEIRVKLGLKGFRVFTVDATSIAIEKLGRNIPNTPMIGALVKVTKATDIKNLIDDFRRAYAHKFNSAILDGNIKAIEEAHNKVKGE